MKKKIEKKRYRSAQELTREIDLYKQKLQRFLDRASSFDLQADDLLKSGLSEDAIYHREQAKKMRRAAFRIEKKRLPFLARKLAALNTELLPGIVEDGDRSVSSRGGIMTCDKIFVAATESRKSLDAPTKLIPGCHPKARIDVYVDSEKEIILICCSRCDKIIDVVKTKWTKYGNITAKHKRSKTKSQG